MKTKFIFCCFLLPLAAMVFWGCPSEKEETPIPLPKDLMPYLSFKEGSWWVYQERQSGHRDSFWVKTRLLDTELDYTVTPNILFEDLGITLKGKRDGVRDTTLGYSCEYSYMLKHDCTHVLSEFDYNPYEHRVKRFFYPFSVDTLLFFAVGFDSTYVAPIQSNIVVKGKNYASVIVAGYPRSYDNDPVLKAMWAKDVGLIYKEMRNGEIWELENYSVEH